MASPPERRIVQAITTLCTRCIDDQFVDEQRVVPKPDPNPDSGPYPGPALRGNTPIALRSGEFTLTLRPRSCHFGGTFSSKNPLTNATYRTDANLRERSHTVVLTLTDDVWALDVATNEHTVQQLVDSVLHSSRHDLGIL